MLNWLLRPLGYNRRMPVEPSNETLYTVEEAAKELHISEGALRQLIRRKRIATELVGHSRMIKQSVIDSFVAKPKGWQNQPK